MEEAAGHRRPRRSSTHASRRDVVERTEAYVRSYGAAIPIADLSRMVGLSERGLREAFYEVRGQGPKRHMLCERLQGVRRALCDAAPGETTVTRVAADYGFFELGRFARAYREMFGEAPSATLRRGNLGSAA